MKFIKQIPFIYIYIYYEFQLSRCRIFKIVIKSHRNTFFRYYNVQNNVKDSQGEYQFEDKVFTETFNEVCINFNEFAKFIIKYTI